MLMHLGKWEFTCNRQATIQAYARAQAGGTATCSCVWCRNFVLVRDGVYPDAFLALLESLGIDPKKDGEVYHNGEIEPGCIIMPLRLPRSHLSQSTRPFSRGPLTPGKTGKTRTV